MRSNVCVVASILLPLAIGCSSSKPKEVEVAELGVSLTVPGDWEVKKRGDGGTMIGAGTTGVILRKESQPITTIEQAREALIMKHRIKEEKALPGGTFFFDYEVDFGTDDKPNWLRYIQSFVTTPKATVSCQLQLMAGQDAAPIAKACSSMRAK